MRREILFTIGGLAALFIVGRTVQHIVETNVKTGNVRREVSRAELVARLRQVYLDRERRSEDWEDTRSNIYRFDLVNQMGEGNYGKYMVDVSICWNELDLPAAEHGTNKLAFFEGTRFIGQCNYESRGAISIVARNAGHTVEVVTEAGERGTIQWQGEMPVIEEGQILNNWVAGKSQY